MFRNMLLWLVILEEGRNSALMILLDEGRRYECLIFHYSRYSLVLFQVMLKTLPRLLNEEFVKLVRIENLNVTLPSFFALSGLVDRN
jgi:hypothetical protein